MGANPVAGTGFGEEAAGAPRARTEDLAEFLLGVKEAIPLMLGVGSFAVAYGILGMQVGMSIPEIVLMSALVYAGAAQFIAVGMLQAGAGVGLIVLSTLLVNLRHLLMGLSLSPYYKKLRLGWLFGLAFGLVDESYARSVIHYTASGRSDGNPYYMLGSSGSLYVTWLGASIAGGLLGSRIGDPLRWGLDFAMPATFISIVVSLVRDRSTLTVLAVAGVSAVAARILVPGMYYIIIAAVLGTLAGLAIDAFGGGDAGCDGR